MLLSITTTHRPATDLGFLLHKNPERLHSSEMSFGNVHVPYPEADAAGCTVALVVEVDPVGLVRERKDHCLRHPVSAAPMAVRVPPSTMPIASRARRVAERARTT